MRALMKGLTLALIVLVTAPSEASAWNGARPRLRDLPGHPGPSGWRWTPAGTRELGRSGGGAHRKPANVSAAAGSASGPGTECGSLWSAGIRSVGEGP